MKEKILFFLVLVLLGSVTFSFGCRSENPGITFILGGAPNDMTFFDGVLQDFTAKTGIKATLIRQPADSAQRKQGILLALRGRQSEPDVMMLDVGWIGQIAASDWLEPLDGYGIDSSVYFKRIIELADTYDGRLIGLPLYIDGGLLYYRRDLLEKYGFSGPPQTWDELRQMSETVMEGERKTNGNFWGYVWQGAQYEGLSCNALEFFTSADGGFFVGTATPAIDQPANLKALRFMCALLKEKPISPPNTFTDMKEEEVRQMFHNGNALFQRNWPYVWALHNASDSPVKGKVGIAPLPGFVAGKGASTLGGWHLAVSKFSDKKKESVELIKYLTSPEIQKILALQLGWNPARMDAYEDDDLLSANPALKDLKKVFEGAVPRPVIPYYSGISQILQKHLSAALASRVSPDNALKAAQAEAEQLISSYGIAVVVSGKKHDGEVNNGIE